MICLNVVSDNVILKL